MCATNTQYMMISRSKIEKETELIKINGRFFATDCTTVVAAIFRISISLNNKMQTIKNRHKEKERKKKKTNETI